MRLTMLRNYYVMALLIGAITPTLVAAPYERMSSVRIVELQESYAKVIAQRRNKRIIVATGAGIASTVGVSWLIYSWLKPADQPKHQPIDTSNAHAQYKAMQAKAIQQFVDDWEKQHELKGAVLNKMRDAFAFGLATALVSFILSRGSSLLEKAHPLLDAIVPMSDIPLLVMALRRAVVGSRQYENTMLLLLEQPVRNGSLAHEITEKTKRLEHKQLIAKLEQIAAWLTCFGDEMGTIGYQEAQTTLGALMQITNKLATLYEQEESNLDEARELLSTMRLQAEQLASLIIPVLQELGYEQI